LEKRIVAQSLDPHTISLADRECSLFIDPTSGSIFVDEGAGEGRVNGAVFTPANGPSFFVSLAAGPDHLLTLDYSGFRFIVGVSADSSELRRWAESANLLLEEKRKETGAHISEAKPAVTVIYPEPLEVVVLGFDPGFQTLASTVLAEAGIRKCWIAAADVATVRPLFDDDSLFAGHLIVLTLPVDEVDVFTHRLGSGRYAATNEILNAASPEFRLYDLYSALAAAELYCIRNPHCRLLVVTRHAGPPDPIPNGPDYLEVAVWDADHPPDLGTFILAFRRDRYGFPIQRPTGPQLAEPAAGWKTLGQSRAREFASRLLHEFVTAESEAEFLAICADVFPAAAAPKLPAPTEYQMALLALRLARQMVTWSLEGRPFECTVLLCTDTAYRLETQDGFGERRRYATLFNFDPPVPFHIGHLQKVREHAELTQSGGLLMFVDASRGTLTRVSVMHSQSDEVPRLKRLREFSTGNEIVVHMRGGNTVEVYVKQRLRLKYDGFQWVPNPLTDLSHLVHRHLSLARPPEPFWIQRLEEVVHALLDSHLSSIILLLHPADEPTLAQMDGLGKFSPMRDEVVPVPRQGPPVPVWVYPIASLIGLLKIDGIHVIDANGGLKYLGYKSSLQVSEYLASKDEYPRLKDWCRKRADGKLWADVDEESGHLVVEGPLTDDQVERLSEPCRTGVRAAQAAPTPRGEHADGRPRRPADPGTGGSAAKGLSQLLRYSFVIKVSSSGFLRLYQKGRAYRPPRV
jgi:hypothetical protein